MSTGRTVKSLGYLDELEKEYDAAILKIYHELGLHRFFNNRAGNENFKFNTNSILILLIVSRLLSPGSKKKAFEEKGCYAIHANITPLLPKPL